MNATELEARLLAAIPLARAMGVRVGQADPDAVMLTAPLEPLNINHERTAFGGSLHAVGVLAGWALVTLGLENAPVGYLVIQESQIEYLRPVQGDFAARAVWAGAKARFFEGLRRKALARAAVRVEIVCGDQVCAVLTARFVAEVEKR